MKTAFPSNPFAAAAGILRHRYLLGQLVKRDVLLRYRGALFGAAWLFLSPLLMLGIFVFVFGSVVRFRWPEQDAGVPFWIVLYAGLIVFSIFSETLSRAPSCVRNHPNFVKKIVFPVELLPLVPLCAALLQAAFNLLILTTALAWIGRLHLQILLFPLLVVPLLLLTLGLAWFVAAWGVFIKDMAQVVPLLVQMLLFLSPVFYPVSAVPEFLQPFYKYNPLGAVIEACRAAALGLPISWWPWLAASIVGLVAAILGFAFFSYAREEFADVL